MKFDKTSTKYNILTLTPTPTVLIKNKVLYIHCYIHTAILVNINVKKLEHLNITYSDA